MRRDPKTCCFDFDLPKDIDENLKREFIIKTNESLAEIIIKNEVEEIILKYKHGNNIHENGKQQSEWATQIFS